MKVFAARHHDGDVVMNSRSGGIFTALSDCFLEDGKVYGCILDEQLHAIHIGTSSKSVRDKMRGSKYVQSDLGESFKSIKEDLENNLNILFSGTSCQVDGLKRFLQKDYPNLLCVDIVCHGVPSPKVFESYLQYQGNVTAVDFRNKKDFGWRNHVETLTVDGNKINSTVWTNLFYSGVILRPSCYECPYKSIEHPGDITIADYWGIEKAAPEFDDDRGVSLALINTNKGCEYFDRIKGLLVYKETRIEDSMQRAFIRSEIRPQKRDRFWNDFNEKDFRYLTKVYGGQLSLLRKVTLKCKMLVKSLFLLFKKESEV